jgi:hypothetical protein
MRYMLVMDEGQRPSGFATMQELSNVDTLPDSLVLEFFSHFKPGLRMIRDQRMNATDAFSFAHFLINPDSQEMLPSMMAPIYAHAAMDALDSGVYESVFVGTVTNLPQIHESAILPSMGLYARQQDGQIVNVRNGAVHSTDNGPRVRLVPLATFVRVGHLPVYVMFLNSDLVRVTDGFDFVDIERQCTWVRVAGNETFKHALYDPWFSANVTAVQSGIIAVSGSSFEINLLNPRYSPIKASDLDPHIQTDTWEVVSNVDVVQQGGKFVVQTPCKGTIGVLTITHDVGGFIGSPVYNEHPSFTYIIVPL